MFRWRWVLAGWRSAMASGVSFEPLAKPLSIRRIWVVGMRWWLRSGRAATTSRSPILGLARHHMIGILRPASVRAFNSRWVFPCCGG